MTAPNLDIDADIRRAWTPPAALYGDPTLYALQLERVFAPAWHALPELAAADDVAPSHARPFALLPDSLHEPLLHAVDAAGAAHLLSNVCTHRGHRLCAAPVQGAQLRCRYHGRRFGLDGKLAAAPGFEGALSFPSPGDDLPRLPLERLGPVRFTSLQPEVEFAAAVSGAERLAPLLARAHRFDPAGAADYEVAAHWALYVDNYLEGFHIPFVHPELAGVLQPGAYRTELLPFGTLQTGFAAEGEPAFALPAEHPDAGARVAAYYLWLLPGTMLNLYPWGLSLNVVEPLGPSRTRVRFLPFVADASLRTQGAGGPLDLVEQQDEEVVEGVAEGLRARLYGRGRYAPEHEQGVHHFHRLLAARLDARAREGSLG